MSITWTNWAHCFLTLYVPRSEWKKRERTEWESGPVLGFLLGEGTFSSFLLVLKPCAGALIPPVCPLWSDMPGVTVEEPTLLIFYCKHLKTISLWCSTIWENWRPLEPAGEKLVVVEKSKAHFGQWVIGRLWYVFLCFFPVYGSSLYSFSL